VIPGSFLAGEYPGATTTEAAREKLSRIREAGVGLFLDLTEDREYGLRPYAPLLPSGAHRRHAVPDLDHPTDVQMSAILDEIDAAIAEGQTVYVHCYGGVGRTGTVVGCYLVRHGKTGDEALDLIAAWRRGTPDGARSSPETHAQRTFVRSWRVGA
jgi:hypothetical protein